MFKIVSVVFITLSVMIIHGDRSLVQAEVFEGGINDISHEANPWRRFWGGQCDSDSSCTYIVSYCHYKKTGECFVSISSFNFNPYSFVANTCLPAWWFSLIVKLGIFFCVLVTVFCIVDCLTFFIEITEPVDHRVSGAPVYRI